MTFTSRPVVNPAEHRETIELLNRVYSVERLSVAGPPIPFDADVALTAAEFLRWACWFAVNRAEPAEEVERLLVVPAAPRTAAHHLSADLTFRYLTNVYRRARALSADDPLTVRLEGVLKRFPLSGVLSDVAASPTVGLEFDDHAGLQLLYAERFVRHKRPAWRPTGRTGEFVDRVSAAPV